MPRRHAVFVASILGLAAVIGVGALGRTLALGATAGASQDALVVRRTRQLDRFEATLRHQLAASKPQLTAARTIPDTKSSLAPALTPQRVVYVRPAPTVAVGHHEDGAAEDEGVEHEEPDGSEMDD